jgi:hypothetical protein
VWSGSGCGKNNFRSTTLQRKQRISIGDSVKHILICQTAKLNYCRKVDRANIRCNPKKLDLSSIRDGSFGTWKNKFEESLKYFFKDQRRFSSKFNLVRAGI